MITRIVMLFALVQILSNRPRLSTAAQSLPQKSNNVHLKHGVVLDFLQKVISTKNLAIDQYRDSKSTLNEIYDLLNKEFPDSRPTPTSIRTQNQTAASTNGDGGNEPYNISRYELGQIIGRNLRSLKRVGDLELMDAFNQSRLNVAEYRTEVRKLFAKKIS